MTELPPRWMHVVDGLVRTLEWNLRRGLRIERAWTPPDEALAGLSQHVYQRHFAQWRAPSGIAARHAGRASGDPAFVEQVALAVHGAFGWDDGWEVIQRAGDWRFVHSGRMQLFVHAATELHPSTARVGQRAAVRMPCLREGLVPGFLYAFSRAGAIDPGEPHVRIYLNVDPRRGVQVLTDLLMSPRYAKQRFEAKLPSDPASFDRCDPMVVYAHPSSASAILRTLLRDRRRAPSGWHRPTPFAAHHLANGIALAESPPLLEENARSFGQHRSGLLAEAVLGALRDGDRSSIEQRLLKALRREGIDPALPHAQRLPKAFWKRLLSSVRR